MGCGPTLSNKSASPCCCGESCSSCDSGKTPTHLQIQFSAMGLSTAFAGPNCDNGENAQVNSQTITIGHDDSQSGNPAATGCGYSYCFTGAGTCWFVFAFFSSSGGHTFLNVYLLCDGCGSGGYTGGVSTGGILWQIDLGAQTGGTVECKGLLSGGVTSGTGTIVGNLTNCVGTWTTLGTVTVTSVP